MIKFINMLKEKGLLNKSVIINKTADKLTVKAICKKI